MCEQCLVNPLFYGQVFGDWQLIRARRDGNEMKVGDWGLVLVNDPSFVWQTSPMISDEYAPDDFYQSLCCMLPLQGKRFAESCISAGFKGDSDYDLVDWLWRKVVMCAQNTPSTWEDAFPQLDEIRNHDYSLGMTDQKSSQ